MLFKELTDFGLQNIDGNTVDGEKAWPVMRTLSQALSDIEVDCSILECEGEPCLFVNMQDEFAATCRLKNFGVAIAEPFSGNNPF